MTQRSKTVLLALLLAGLLGASHEGHTQGGPLVVDTSDRQAVRDLFFDVYLATENVPHGWTGNHGSCTAGVLSPAFLEATRLRINYYRAMAGLNGDIALDTAYNAQCQAAALILSANDFLGHNPDPSLTCFTSDGLTGAQRSNITQNALGPDAVDLFMEDPGFINTAVPHRRHLMNPTQQLMGVGAVPQASVIQPSATAIYVLGPSSGLVKTVKWPPAGYVPFQVVFQRWSYSRKNADFSNATVHVTLNGNRVEYNPLPLSSGYADNTLVWSPSTTFPPPGIETYTVEIGNYFMPGVPEAQSETYEVIRFNPYIEPVVVEIAAGTGSGFVEEGNPLTLAVPGGFSGYQWLRDGVPLVEDAPRLTGVQSSTLHFDPVIMEDAGVYTCAFDDGSKAPALSEPFTLEVLPPGSLPLGKGWLLAIPGVLLAAWSTRRYRARQRHPGALRNVL
ncbi:MAG: hypothetical protein HYV27_06015 [Candidatus Hydrogenedentes bacterium]|nr:hypothetical protein [Candidatus Hydrogenedentota bacterium]